MESLKEALVSLNAEIDRMENCGRIDFSRITEKGHTGDTYVVADLAAPAGFTAEVREKFRLDNNVKRVFVERLA